MLGPIAAKISRWYSGGCRRSRGWGAVPGGEGGEPLKLVGLKI